MASYRYHVHAIDASSQGVEKLEKYAHLQGLDNIEGEVADERTVRLKPNYYDSIVTVTSLDHTSVVIWRIVRCSFGHSGTKRYLTYSKRGEKIKDAKPLQPLSL